MIEQLLVNAGVTLGIVLPGWLYSLKIRDVSFIDAIWGAAMAVLALASWLQLEAPGIVAHVVLAMTLVWGLRLALHLLTRWRREGEDPRYARILGDDKEKGRFAIAALGKVFLLQGVLLFLVCLPAQLAILGSAAPAPMTLLAWVGVGLWMVGFYFEAVGDAQLKVFRADPDNENKVLDKGLWRYTRHPNYFGDFCVWWGIWIVCLSVDPMLALYSVVGPVFLSFTLMKWSGVPLMERDMDERRPAYADYVKTTSAFFPMPPKD